MQMTQTQALHLNAAASTIWSDICAVHYVERTDTGSKWHTPPSCYPRRVAKFLHLTDIELVTLLRFYRLSPDDDEITLPRYVINHREEARAQVAQAMGLDYPSIKFALDVMKRQQQDVAEPQATKRPADDVTHAVRHANHPADGPMKSTHSQHLSIATSDWMVPAVPREASSPKKDSDVVVWETPSTSRRQRQRLEERRRDRQKLATRPRTDASSSKSFMKDVESSESTSDGPTAEQTSPRAKSGSTIPRHGK